MVKQPLRPALLLSLLFLTLPVHAADLWRQAVDHYRNNEGLSPGWMSIRFDQYNGRGRLLSSDYSELRIWESPDGELHSTVLYATRDGEEVTDESREDSAGGAPFGDDDGESDSPFAGLMRSPFDPEEQDSVEVTGGTSTEIVDGILARVFHYEHEASSKGGTVGTAWLDDQTGMPVRLVARMEPMPGYIDVFEMIQVFDTDSEGRWVLSRMSFEGEGNILFVRRRIESEFEFVDYFPRTDEGLH